MPESSLRTHIPNEAFLSGVRFMQNSSKSCRAHPSPVSHVPRQLVPALVAMSLPFKSFARFILKVDRALSGEMLLTDTDRQVYQFQWELK
jgi:hypothetical protein